VTINWVVWETDCRLVWVAVAVICIELIPTSELLVDLIEKSSFLFDEFYSNEMKAGQDVDFSFVTS
jgi:hypothetical protein